MAQGPRKPSALLAPGKMFADFLYLFPPKGRVWVSARWKRSPFMHFLFSLPIYAIMLFLLMVGIAALFKNNTGVMQSAPAPAAFDPANPGVQSIALAVDRVIPMAGTADARSAPRADAAVVTRLNRGVPVRVIAVLAGNLWLKVELADHQAAFIPAAAIPNALAWSAATAPNAGPSAPSPEIAQIPETINGHAEVVNTGTITINGQRVELFGIEGEGQPFAAQLKALIDSNGGVVSCDRHGTQYICSLPGNLDIGRMALFNGAALPAANATPDYLNMAAIARTGRRGVWH
jgi:hypothetical protein